MKVPALLFLAAPAAAQMFCPTGQGLFHTSHIVKNGFDDVEEAHVDAAGNSPTDCLEGFLYQGSSDLELGNDVECGSVGGQYVGIRFQDVAVPAGATVMQAHIKFTVDESTNPGDHGTDGSDFLGTGDATNQGDGNWTAPMVAQIKARKSANAPEWLPADSTDPRIVSNRDCPADSQCKLILRLEPRLAA